VPDEITIQVDGLDYSGWTSVTVRRSMEALCGQFNMTTVDRWTLNHRDWVIYPGKACRIDIGTETILEGYVDSVDPSITAASHTISIKGRDATADLVDCAAPDRPGTWNNVTLLALAQAMADPFDITVRSEVGLGDKFSKFSVKSGESINDALQRAAQKRHVLLMTGRVGNLIITNTGADMAFDRLVMGDNVLSASGGFDFTNRFSEYIVKGQSRTAGSGWTAQTISVKGTAEDEEVTRHRPKLIKGSGISTVSDAETQAAWEANVRAGKSFKASVSVVGYRQTNGALWETNRIVNVDIPQLLLHGSMLISAIEYTKSESGSFTNMELTRPDSYIDAPPKKVRKRAGLGW
jgi:prophage tail gpP-like protein